MSWPYDLVPPNWLEAFEWFFEKARDDPRVVARKIEIDEIESGEFIILRMEIAVPKEARE